MALDYNTLAERIRAAGPTVTSGGGYYYDPTSEGGGGGGGSGYVEPYTSEDYSITSDGKIYTLDPSTGRIRESFVNEPKRAFNPEAQASGYYTNVYNPDGSVERVFNRQKGTWEQTKPLVGALVGLGTLGYGLGALGAAGAAGAAAPAAAGGELAGLASLGGTSAYGLPAGATVLMDGTVVSAAGEVLGTAPATFGSVIPGASAAGAGGAAASTLGSKVAQTVGGQLLNRALRGSSGGAANGGAAGAAGGVNPALLAALLGGGGSAFSPVSDKTYKPTLLQQGNLYEAGIPSLTKSETPKYTSESEKEDTFYMARGGLAGIAPQQYAAGGRFLSGPGDGTSDSIRANIEGKQEARLADGEFVLPADIVSHIGNGSSKAGAEKLYAMMDNIRRARTGTAKMGKTIKADKYLPA